MQNLNDDQVLIQSLQSDDFHPFPMRLGLSATPWNPYDDARNEYVAHGFVNGEVDFGVEHWEGHLIENNMVFHFGLKDGIERGILCPFDYHPLEYTPSKSDFEERAMQPFEKFQGTFPSTSGRFMDEFNRQRCSRNQKRNLTHSRIG